MSFCNISNVVIQRFFSLFYLIVKIFKRSFHNVFCPCNLFL